MPTGDERLHRVKSLQMDAEKFDASLGRISESIGERNLDALLRELGRLVPEYQPSETLLGLLNPSLA